MSLNIIYGRSGSGKTTALFEKLKVSLEKDPDIHRKRYVIVPDQFSYMMEKKILDTFGDRYVFSIQVLGFRMLSERILERVGGIRKVILGPAGRSMLISSIASDLKDDLTIYKKSAEFAGFSEVLSQTIKELKNYSITAEDLKAACEELKIGELKNKVMDLALIFERYETELHEGFIDDEDRMTMAVEKLKVSDYLKGSEFYLDEFSDFTPMQLDFISELLRKGDTYITLTLDKNIGDRYEGVFSLTRDTYNDLVRIAGETGVSFSAPLFTEGPARFRENSELAFLEREYFSYPNKTMKGKPSSVRIRRCQDPYEEMEFVAKDILRRVREENIRFNEIAILLRNMESYKSIIRSVMKEFEIPVFIDSRKDIDVNPLASFVSSFFEINDTDFAMDPVFRYLKSGLTDIEREDIDTLENYCLANGITGWKWDDEYWQYKVYDTKDKKKAERILTIINETKDLFREPLLKAYEKIEEGKTVREKCTAFYDFLDESGVLERFNAWIEEFKDTDNEKYLEYTQVQNALMDILDQMVMALGDKETDFESFGNTILTGFSSSKISVVPPALDRVIAGDIARVRASGVRGIYIVGVNDGVLPRSADSAGIFTDSDREGLSKVDLRLSKDSRIRAFYEQFYVYNALTIGDRFLTVTYPSADPEGKALRPSQVPGRIRKLFPDLTEEDSLSDKDDLNMISGKNEAFRLLLSKIRKHHDGYTIDDTWRGIYSYFEDSQYRERLLACERGIRYSNTPELLSREAVERLYGKKLNMTVSRVEKFNSCPFSYFVRYGLKAEARKEFRLDTPDMGILMHDVIDRFTRKLEAERLSWKDVTDTYTEKSVEKLMEQHFDEEPNSIFLTSERNRYMGKKVARIISSSLKTIREQVVKGEFVPMFSEIDFKKGGILEPLNIKLPDGSEADITGRIDRVDVFNDKDRYYVRIIDYKTFSKEMSLKDVYYGLQLQLLIYLNVILENREKFTDGDTIPGAVLYLKVDRPIIENGRTRTEEELKNEIMKSLRMKGIILKDAKVLVSMDRDLGVSGVSLVIPAKKNPKTGEFSSSEKSTADLTEEEFTELREYADSLVRRSCMDIINGKIDIVPYKDKDRTACAFCDYRSVCQFDPSLKNMDYKRIREMDKEEIFRSIREEKGGIE